TAIEDGNDFVINGEKSFITNASFASAIIVTAITGKDKQGKSTISAFIVPTDLPGMTITNHYDKMGVRGSDTAGVILDQVRIPQENLLGKRDQGFKQFLHTLDGGRISIAALGVGIAQASLDKALHYAKERTQFGRPIANFQAIQFKLADMAMEVELARNIDRKSTRLNSSHVSISYA